MYVLKKWCKDGKSKHLALVQYIIVDSTDL